MLQQRSASSIWIKLFVDSLCVVLSFFCTYFFRSQITTHPFQIVEPVRHYIWLLLISLPVWWGLLFAFRIYSTKVYNTRQRIFLFSKMGLGVLLFLSLIFFLLQVSDANRTLVIPYVGLAATFMLGWRAIVTALIGVDPRRLLLVGEFEELQTILFAIELAAPKQYQLTGYLAEQKLDLSANLTYRGAYSDLFRILHDEVIDEVAFAMPVSNLTDNPELLRVCRMLGIDALALAEFPEGSPVQVERFFGLPVLFFPSAPLHTLAFSVKAIADRLIAFFASVALLPLMLFIGIAIKLTSKGPAIFVQERAGLNGRTFRMYKFRTMVADAADRHHELKAYNEMNGPVFKIRNDPRVTGLGHFLRKFSLDELPQIWNVLKGDMSLVGPRPLPLSEARQIKEAQRRRLSVKPGITCIWQIRGRNEVDYEEWMSMDLQYIDNWSLWLDFTILVQTFSAVVLAKGAS